MSESRIYILELNETPHRFPDLEGALEFLKQVAQTDRAVLWAEIDHCPRQMPWWERILGIHDDRDLEQCFLLEKAGRVATLVFYDDAHSEYRTIDSAHPVQATEEERLAVSHGEALPAPLDECVSSDRAFQAAAEYLQRGERPDWMTYRYVK